MNCCRYCARFEANPTDRRRAGRCTLNGDRAAPGSNCAQFADAFDGFIADLLDWLRAAGCDLHLTSSNADPRLTVQLSGEWHLNCLYITRHGASVMDFFVVEGQI